LQNQRYLVSPVQSDYAEGAIVSKTVLKKQTGNISLFSFGKGEALSEHTAPFDALIQVVDGRGEIIIGGKSFLSGNRSEYNPACRCTSCCQSR